MCLQFSFISLCMPKKTRPCTRTRMVEYQMQHANTRILRLSLQTVVRGIGGRAVAGQSRWHFAPNTHYYSTPDGGRTTKEFQLSDFGSTRTLTSKCHQKKPHQQYHRTASGFCVRRLEPRPLTRDSANAHVVPNSSIYLFQNRTIGLQTRRALSTIGS